MLDFLENSSHYQQIAWAIKMFIIIFISLVLSYVAGRLVRNCEKKLSHNKAIWDDLLLRSIRKPLISLIWILGVALAINTTGQHIRVDFYNFVLIFKNLGIIFCIAWFIWRIVAEYEKYLTSEKSDHLDVTTVVAITKLLKIAILITTGLMMLQNFGVNINGIIAFGGIGGIAVGFAAKDLLANFFGALVIFLDRPFSVGDFIRSPDRQIDGAVQYISWRLTHILTPDKRLLYIPNSLFSTIIIENLSRTINRRIHEDVRLRYQDIKKSAKIIDELKEFLTNHKEIDKTLPITVIISKLDEYCVTLVVEAFTGNISIPEYNEIKQEILLKVDEVILKNGAEIALPRSVINILD